MRQLNCLIWALRQWFRRGGYLIIRRSRHLTIPHFLWAPKDGLDSCKGIRHYTPTHPKKSGWWRALRFHGSVRYCDREECPVQDDPQCQLCKFDKDRAPWFKPKD